MRNTKPSIRFDGFTDDWVQRKFGELYKKVNEKNDLSFGQDRVISVANMYFKDSADIRSDDSYMRTYNIFRIGDIAFEGNRSKYFSYGRFVENTIGDGIISHVFDVFRPIVEFDLTYWKYAIHNERIMGRILMTSTTSSTMMTNLVSKDFLKRSTLVPSVSEQEKIGSFFKQLDNTIDLHQRQLDLLKEQKKGFLQKMFPKQGEKIPELRFAEFTDDWVQRKVGDFLTESRIPGTNGAISKKLTVKLWGKGVIPKETVTDGSEATKYYVRKAGQFMYGKLDFLHAAFGIVPENLDGYESTLDSPSFDIANLNSTFLMDTVMRKSFYLYQGNIANGSRKAKRIHVDTFSNMPIDVTTLDEQDKIGHFFDRLDNLIAANQRKLDLLKELKKGYLQKMFV
ncbi:restriction endonuclease subunit S [Weissella confusa]|uniref:restriction endonuclease subunit S n=1 Tax=Weissella confusa TaxID=1583 RepID=UPI0018A29486|nr:restriction endonuclease subunit S [Weissella confusa]MBF7056559.1 restriction endonuclease subunit S [Weissella confusa]